MMKMRRKWFAWLVVMLFIVGLSACAGSTGDDEAKATGGIAIEMNGGQGTGQDGGDGGYVYMYTYGIKGVNILNGTKSIKTSFSFPKEAEREFGDVLLEVASDMTIDVYVDQGTAQGAVSNGDYYMYVGNDSIWLRDSVGGDVPVTGLKINKGKTLTLGLNYNRGGATGQDTAVVDFEDDVYIAGTLTVKSLDTGDVGGLTIETRHGAPATPADSGALEIDSDYNIWVTGSGKIDVSGADAAAGSGDRGGDGGSFDLYSNDGHIYVYGELNASGGDGDGAGDGGNAGWQASWSDTSYIDLDDGSAVTRGANILLNGGDGAVGGDAGDFYVEAYFNWYNTAAIRANGGNGSNGDGGDGGYMYFEAYYGSIYSNGTIQSNGGDAVNGDGGDADDIDFYPGYDDYMGEMSVAGRIEMLGGDAVNGNGGDGAEVEYYMYSSGEIRSTAAILADGGDSTGAGNYGGDGGDLYIYKEVGYDQGYGSDYVNPESVLISGKISLNGGDGDYGGDGGSVYAESSYDPETNAPDHGIFFYGYSAIQADGGDGAVNGGDGGYVDLETSYSWTEYMYAYWQAGPIVDQTDFYGRGGDGATGSGGNGDYYYAYTDYYTSAGETNFIHRGNIYLGGGDGATGGGDAGYVWVYAVDFTKVSGNIDTSGGNGTGANADGGDGNYVELYSTYDVVLNGNINSKGGDATGTGTGGEGGNWHYLEAGNRTVINGNIDMRGGDGDASAGTGGDGGWAWITSETEGSRLNGSFWIDGGDANTDGTDGGLYMDGGLMDGDR